MQEKTTSVHHLASFALFQQLQNPEMDTVTLVGAGRQALLFHALVNNQQAGN
jgi:hypothetical protein